jgi:hypothetical protein
MNEVDLIRLTRVGQSNILQSACHTPDKDIPPICLSVDLCDPQGIYVLGRYYRYTIATVGY